MKNLPLLMVALALAVPCMAETANEAAAQNAVSVALQDETVDKMIAMLTKEDGLIRGEASAKRSANLCDKKKRCADQYLVSIQLDAKEKGFMTVFVLVDMNGKSKPDVALLFPPNFKY